MAGRIRVTVYRNGSISDGKAVVIDPTDDLELFKHKIVAKLAMQVKRIFTSNGGEIDALDELCANDVLYASSGEDYKQGNNFFFPV